MRGPGVVVGFDGSAASARAIEWAAGEARIRRLPLTVCHAWELPAHMVAPAEGEPVRHAAKEVLARGMAVAACHGPGIPVVTRLLNGPAAPALVYAAEGAELLVAGARGGGGYAWLGLGSVSSQLATHARCPLEVVRGDGRWRGHGIVVGVDGSASSENAVGFAFEEAALRAMPLTAVASCWESAASARAWAADTAAVASLEDSARQRAEAVTERWREKFPEVTFSLSIVTQPPRTALLDAAQDAALLVVGERGLGGFPGMLLGSVSQAVVDHASCPVTIVRAAA